MKTHEIIGINNSLSTAITTNLNGTQLYEFLNVKKAASKVHKEYSEAQEDTVKELKLDTSKPNWDRDPKFNEVITLLLDADVEFTSNISQETFEALNSASKWNGAQVELIHTNLVTK